MAVKILPSFNEVQAPRLATQDQPPPSKPIIPRLSIVYHKPAEISSFFGPKRLLWARSCAWRAFCPLVDAPIASDLTESPAYATISPIGDMVDYGTLCCSRPTRNGSSSTFPQPVDNSVERLFESGGFFPKTGRFYGKKMCKAEDNRLKTGDVRFPACTAPAPSCQEKPAPRLSDIPMGG